jgi:hypothetical protein
MRCNVAVILALAVLAACTGDVVTTRYASLDQARAHHLFGRGWLPDILPPSSRDIRTSNNLDLNLAEGEFHFDPAEFKAFSSRMEPFTPIRGMPFGLDEEAKEHSKNGLRLYVYTQDRSTWFFLCEPAAGLCEFRMSLQQN